MFTANELISTIWKALWFSCHENWSIYIDAHSFQQTEIRRLIAENDSKHPVITFSSFAEKFINKTFDYSIHLRDHSIVHLLMHAYQILKLSSYSLPIRKDL